MEEEFQVDYKEEMILELDKNKELVEDLKKYGMYDKVINFPNDGIINIDFIDIKNVLNAGKLIAYSYKKYKKDEDIELTFIKDKYQEPKMLVNIKCDENTSLYDINNVIESIKRYDSNLEIVYGVEIDPKIKQDELEVMIVMLGKTNSN